MAQAASVIRLVNELLIEALLLIREHAQNPSLSNSLTAFAPRWREMAQKVAIQSNSELILTLSAFAKGGSAQLIPALTALLPALEKEGGSGLLTHLVRLVE